MRFFGGEGGRPHHTKSFCHCNYLCDGFTQYCYRNHRFGIITWRSGHLGSSTYESDDEDEAGLDYDFVTLVIVSTFANVITELLKLIPRTFSLNRRDLIEIENAPLLKVEDSIES